RGEKSASRLKAEANWRTVGRLHDAPASRTAKEPAPSLPAAGRPLATRARSAHVHLRRLAARTLRRDARDRPRALPRPDLDPAAGRAAQRDLFRLAAGRPRGLGARARAPALRDLAGRQGALGPLRPFARRRRPERAEGPRRGELPREAPELGPPAR